MKKLNEIIDCPYDILINDIKTNSLNVKKNDLFVCINTGTMDRHLFIDDAIKNGASAIIANKELKKSVPVIKVDDVNKTFSEIVPKFYDYPLDKLKLIGVTGTDGKTTVSTIISTLINSGYIGTNGIKCGEYYEKTSNTTPSLEKLYSIFNYCVLNNIKSLAMEVSSEAIKYERTRGIKFDCSILTNITKEHLNTHKTLENYIACKCELFENTKKEGICVLNKDDAHYNDVLSKCNGKVLTYGINEDNDLQISDVKLLSNKTLFKIKYNNTFYNIESPLLAMFNVYNLSAALLALFSLGYDINTILSRIKELKVSGRLQEIKEGQPFKVFVDYAHTPNGISELLKFVNSIEHNKTIVVFSEPGERDRSKRPDKGFNVITNCDYAFITSQDPRSEDPYDIACDLTTLVKDYDNYEIIIDRKEAIKKAIDMAEKNDIVLIIGKGSENYQIIKDKVIEFCDVDEVINYLRIKKTTF